MAKRKVIADPVNPSRGYKFTPERCAAIVEMITNFVPYKLAAEANGICEETLFAWLNDGLNDTRQDLDTEKARFSIAIKKASVNRVQQLTSNIFQGMDKWQSNAWLLERAYRQHFGADAGVINDLLKMFEELKGKLDAKQEK